MDSDFRARFETVIKNRPAWQALANDADFLKRLWE